ncbi:MAG: hypothetical protein AB8C84_10765 [Oligoflexales bacterium]
MKYLFALFFVIGCFNSQDSSSPSRDYDPNRKDVTTGSDIIVENQKDILDSDPQAAVIEQKPPEISGLRLARIPHFLLPEVYLHVFITETKNSVDYVKYEICHQSIDCFQFESTQVYDLIEDHYPDGGIPDGQFSIEAKSCYQNTCSDSMKVYGDFKNQIDPIAKKKLNDRRLIISDLHNDLNILRGLFQDYLNDSSKCEMTSQAEMKVIEALNPLVELQLSIHHANYLDLLINNYPGKNDSFSKIKIEETVQSMLEQESIFNQIIINTKVENQNQIGLFCQEGDENLSQDTEEEGGEDKTEEKSDQESPSGFLKSIAGVLGQQFNPVDGFKRNFLNSISDLKDPLRGCTLSCPALISLRARLGQAVPVFTNHLKSLLEIDESLYGSSSVEAIDDL